MELVSQHNHNIDLNDVAGVLDNSQATLRGHTMAVTGVDWKQSDFCGSILATCSDDRVSYSSVKSYRYCEFDTTVFALPTVTYL